MNGVLSDPSYRASLSKHGHDVGQTKKFSSTVGQLLPIYYDKLYPGDKIYLDTELISRTMDLETSAMCDITEYVDFFFVPLTQIYSLFDSWIYSINDVSSSIFDPASVSQYFPYATPATFKQLFDLYYQGQDLTYGQVPRDQFGVSKADNTIRLWQLFGYGNSAFEWFNGYQVQQEGAPTPPENFGMVSLDMTLPAVYQKIYFDYYRLGDLEGNDPSYYNLDAWYEDPSVDSLTLSKLFTMRYRPLRRDMFTAAQTSPIFNENDPSKLNNGNLLGVNQWLSYYNATFVQSDSLQGDLQTQIGFDPYTATDHDTTPANINTVFAMNKLLEVTRRAGKHYDLQTLAHFGQEVPSGIAGEVMYLGSHKSKIVIGDVLATATNSEDDTYLGQVGGKGYGFGKGQNIEFKAPCHGIVMGIYSAVPDVDYQPTGIDRLNTYLHPYDYWTPEYDKLGMQPLFAYQTNTNIQDGLYVRPRNVNENAEVIGWNYRFMESKTKLDLVLGAFTTSLDYWSGSKDGQMNKDLNNYLVPPTYLDRIMLLNFLPQPTQEYLVRTCFDRDPLIHQLRVDCKKVSAMSTYGIDSL